MLGRSFLVMEPRWGGTFSQFSNYHWGISYFFRIVERDSRPFVEVRVGTRKTGYKSDFDLGMFIPLKPDQSAMLTWTEKKRRYAPEYSLECELK
ncbi:MAG: hypothetical protein A2X94_00940 [Bdellovibrionales bacterium GWB1_55_8]|nr:MAG: hypothetical protein A2X94_00940 [Bdellovibrionales bacterium GWB1_55_8]